MQKETMKRNANAPKPVSNKKCDPYANKKGSVATHVESKGYTSKNDNV